MVMSEHSKEQWVESHACKLGQMFATWQDLHEIDPGEYAESLKKGLGDCHDDPLRKSLIESMVGA